MTGIVNSFPGQIKVSVLKNSRTAVVCRLVPCEKNTKVPISNCKKYRRDAMLASPLCVECSEFAKTSIRERRESVCGTSTNRRDASIASLQEADGRQRQYLLQFEYQFDSVLSRDTLPSSKHVLRFDIFHDLALPQSRRQDET